MIPRKDSPSRMSTGERNVIYISPEPKDTEGKKKSKNLKENV